MKLYSTKDNALICKELKHAKTFWSRFIGLMGQSNWKNSDGLWIMPCNSIHMFFMKFPIDVIFTDKNFCILELINNIKPWSITKIVKNSYNVFELPAGTISSKSLELGDTLKIEKNY